jgi:membrane fusion protein (multidrug efflux system)
LANWNNYINWNNSGVRMSATRPVNEAEGARPARSSTARRLLLAAGLVALLGAAAWGARWWTVGRFIESTDDAYLQADSMTVAPKISGYVAEVFVGDNQTVAAGQPLLRLDSRQYEAALEQANATVAARHADVVRGEAGLAQQQASIVQARAQLDGAISNEAYAAAQVKRYEPLASTGAETGERVADLRNSARQASATRAPNSTPLAPAHASRSSTRKTRCCAARLPGASATAPCGSASTCSRVRV